MYIISGCLLGENCKYSGGNNYTDWVVKFCKVHNFISVCPEVAGGLKVPRAPVEIIEGRAVDANGRDVTKEFVLGCEAVWRAALDESQRLGEPIEGAVLKAKSPSCGKGIIYDGTFSHQTTEGDGFLSKYLKEKNIKVISELETDSED